MLKIGQNIKFTAFHLGVKVSEIIIGHKLYNILDLGPYSKVQGLLTLTVLYLLSRQFFKLRVCDELALQKYLLEMFLCVWCTGPIKVFVRNVSVCA